MKAHRNRCAVCPRPIGLGLLMCGAHWRLVPREQQRATVAAYGRWQRHTGPASDSLALIVAYRNARDAAVASARAALQSNATGELT